MDVAETARRRPHANARHKARKRAVDILFEADLRETDAVATLSERTETDERDVHDLTDEIVRGVVAHRSAIDDRIASNLRRGWTPSRMPRVDRVVARIAVWELDHTDQPTDVIISEAVALVGDLSTDQSPALLNGLLASAAKGRPTA